MFRSMRRLKHDMEEEQATGHRFWVVAVDWSGCH